MRPQVVAPANVARVQLRTEAPPPQVRWDTAKTKADHTLRRQQPEERREPEDSGVPEPEGLAATMPKETPNPMPAQAALTHTAATDAAAAKEMAVLPEEAGTVDEGHRMVTRSPLWRSRTDGGSARE